MLRRRSLLALKTEEGAVSQEAETALEAGIVKDTCSPLKVPEGT